MPKTEVNVRQLAYFNSFSFHLYSYAVPLAHLLVYRLWLTFNKPSRRQNGLHFPAVVYVHEQLSNLYICCNDGDIA